MARTVFLSFAAEDQWLAHALRRQAESRSSALEFRDYAVSEPFERARRINVERLIREVFGDDLPRRQDDVAKRRGELGDPQEQGAPEACDRRPALARCLALPGGAHQAGRDHRPSRHRGGRPRARRRGVTGQSDG